MMPRTFVLPAEVTGRRGSTGANIGVKIRYGLWGAAQGMKPLIVVLPRLSEFIEKYAVMITPLLEAGHDAIILDYPS